MTEELAKVYDPKSVEAQVYDLWQAERSFAANPADPKPTYCIVIPPPNVTAALHLGHALNNTLQDVLVRFRRMQQYNTLWMPGTDHAGIATQTVVEKRIMSEENKRRTDFSREDFVARIQQWKDEYESSITNQLKKMGCSCDWDRQRFTMDAVCAKAVRSLFFKLFSDGLIYRGKRLVNWDPATQTVLADDEVEHVSIDGHFWYLRYPLVEPANVNGNAVTHITVATTRPETMLGDTAVAMNPRDPRAAALVGRKVRLPIVGREIPIIADEHVVLSDPDSDDEKAKFSTGFLKVTPAHDPDDYAIGERHGLDVINVMAPDGTISDKHGWEDADSPEAQNLLGMDRFEAREAIVEFFRSEGLLEEVRPYRHQVGHSYRSHVPIEPYLSDQWYVAVKKRIADCGLRIADWVAEHPDLVEQKDGAAYLANSDVPVDSLAGLALAPLLDNRLHFTPERYAVTYRTWLENLRDWPISRQLWWGHQIPVWTRDLELPADVVPTAVEGHDLNAQIIAAFDAAIGGRSFFGKAGDGYLARAGRYFLNIEDVPDKPGWIRTWFCPDASSPETEKRLEAAGWVQDGDVLDTWFSSGLWPFSTLGWPERTPELARYYPGDVLCTAREIITLWVSRMVMLGQYCCGDIPFRDVFIHAMIQDGLGRKMSKSLGNGIDPLVVIDSHGADAMRFTLVSMTTQTQDVRMPLKEIELPDGRKVNSSEKFDLGRNFCNKLWNASRFAMMNLAGAPPWQTISHKTNLSDAWILSRLNSTVRDTTAAIESFRFNELADTLYHFMWDDLCDWYLEIAKTRIGGGAQEPKAVLAHCLDVLLRLLHPVMPFITEEIWGKLNGVAPDRGPTGERAERLLVAAQWPYADAAAISQSVEDEFALLQDIIRQIRNARLEHNVPPKQAVNLAVEATGTLANLISENADLMRSLANVDRVSVQDRLGQRPANAAAISSGGARLYVLDIIDVAAERSRLTKQAETLRKGIAVIEGKLGNDSFLAKAPADLVQRERDRLAKLKAELAAVDAGLAAL
jgi:valyl-tRNA synthetase